MKELKLSQNKITLVDDEEYDVLIKFNWFATLNGNKWYAVVRRFYKPLYLHRYLMSPDRNLYVDHINGDSLDNQKINLRIVQPGVNTQNRSKLKTNTSGYKGVYKKNLHRWAAKIDYNKVQYHLGTFDTKEEAAMAYNKAALQYYGPLANLNVIGVSNANLSI